MSESATFSERSVWAHKIPTPLRNFIRTESGSAAILAGATVAALVWANVDTSARTRRSGRPGSRSRSVTGASRQSVREWVNNGLMTFFFFVVGLEARREFDLGELRERRRVILPLHGRRRRHGRCRSCSTWRINAGRSSAHGWGVAMSTDTAFALGLLALVGRGLPDRVRVFLLTVVVVDDLVALLVIAFFYSSHVAGDAAGHRCRHPGGAARGVPAQGPRRAVLPRRRRRRLARRCTPRASTRSSVGLAMGLVTWAYAPVREDLERGDRPVPAVPRAADARAGHGLRPPASTRRCRPTTCCSSKFHPWTSYVIVPVFALANAGISHQRLVPGARLHLADHPGRPHRLRRRQADRRARASPGGHHAQPRAGCGRRSAGLRSPAAVPSPASASPSRS